MGPRDTSARWLALGTGLRRGDIDALKMSDIDFAGNYITTMSRKTGKGLGARPVSASIMSEISKYVSRYAANQEQLFNDKFNSRQWKHICQDAKLEGLKFHDLRKTFCSILAQRGISTAVTQNQKLFLNGSLFLIWANALQSRISLRPPGCRIQCSATRSVLSIRVSAVHHRVHIIDVPAHFRTFKSSAQSANINGTVL